MNIYRVAEGRLSFHYAVVTVAAVPLDPLQPPMPSDDAEAVAWFPVAELRGMTGESPCGCCVSVFGEGRRGGGVPGYLRTAHTACACMLQDW